MIVRLLSATLFPYTTLFRSPSDVAPENWHGPAQPSAHAHMPTKNTAAAHGGTAALMYSEIAMSGSRSEEHTSELQSRGHLVCRLLLVKQNDENRIKTTVK